MVSGQNISTIWTPYTAGSIQKEMREVNVLFQKHPKSQLFSHFHSLAVGLGQIQTSDTEQFLTIPIRA